MKEFDLALVMKFRDEMSTGLRNAKGELNNFAAGVTDVRGAIAALTGGAIAAVGAQAVRMAVDLARAGSEAAEVRGQFERLAAGVGQSSAALLSAMQAGTGGLVSNVDLMKSANQDLVAQMQITADEWVMVGQVAQMQSDAMGISVTQAFDAITTSMARGSGRMLDSIGLAIDEQRAFEAFAGALGKSATSLNEAERRQAILNEVLRVGQSQTGATADEMIGLADSMDSLSVAADNAKTAFGEWLATSDMGQWAAKQTSALAGVFNMMANAQQGVTVMDILRQHEMEVAIAAADAASEGARFGGSLAQVAQAATTAAWGMGKLSAATKAYIYGASALSRDNDLRESMKDLWTEADSLSELHTQNVEARSQEVVDAEENAADQVGAAWSSAYSEAQQAAQEFQSDVEGLFQFSMSVNTTDVLDSLGFHQDTWDEWMRRAADVMNQGAASPWFEQLKASFPKFTELLAAMGDPKAAAAAFIDQFQKGFVPEAINIDAIVKAYQEQLASERAWAAIYDQAKAAIMAAGGGQVDETVLKQVTGADEFGAVQSGFDQVGGSVTGVRNDVALLQKAAANAVPAMTKDLNQATLATNDWHKKLQDVIRDFQTISGLGFTVTITPVSGAGGAGGQGGNPQNQGQGAGPGPQGQGAGPGGGGPGGPNPQNQGQGGGAPDRGGNPHGQGINLNVYADESFRDALLRAGVRL